MGLRPGAQHSDRRPSASSRSMEWYPQCSHEFFASKRGGKPQLNIAGAFDGEHYQGLNSSRTPVISAVVSEVRRQFDLQTAVDVGCGVGYFSAFLRSLGFQVIAVD